MGFQPGCGKLLRVIHRKSGVDNAARGNVESPDCRTLADLIANGMKAVAVIPSSEVPEHILKKYVVLPIDLAEYQVEPMVVRLKDHYLTTAAQTMIHHFLTMEEQLQPPSDIESAEAADRL